MVAEALTRPVGFVRGGGGSLGASQVGMGLLNPMKAP